MSSHHIIRDDQEPALIIANGAACNPELLGQLLEWSPLVIVLDSAIERVIDLGIKIDVLLGDFDRGFDPEVYKTSQYPIEIVHTPDQNKTDLEKAFDYLIESKSATIKTNELPTVDSIPSQLRQVFQNLIGNALKFSGTENKPEIEITSEIIVDKSIDSPTSPEGKFCRITVKDNGIGIEAENIDRIFEPKFTTKNSGMGLGLGIIKNIIENYKGTITFETEYGKGTIFTVSLPIIE